MAKKTKKYLSSAYYNQKTRKWNTFKQKTKNGEPVYNKDGSPKMVFAKLSDIGKGVQLYKYDNGFKPIRKRSNKVDDYAWAKNAKANELNLHEPITGKPSTVKIITERKSKSLREMMEEYVPTNSQMLASARKDKSGSYRVDAPFEEVTTYIQGFSKKQQLEYYNILFTANKVIETVRNMTGADVGFFFSLSMPKSEEVRQRREASALEILGIEGLSQEEQKEYIDMLKLDNEKAKALILDIAQVNLETTSEDYKKEFLEIYESFLRDEKEIEALKEAMDTVSPLEFYQIANRAGYRQMRYYIESQISQEDYQNVLRDLHALIGDIYNKSDILD